MISCGPFTSLVWNSLLMTLKVLYAVAVLELTFPCSSAALPLVSELTNGDSRNAFIVSLAGESVEHFKQLLLCHFYRT